MVLRTEDSDATARFLLTQTAAHDLEITAHSLEDAFIALTTDSADTSADTTTDTTIGSL